MCWHCFKQGTTPPPRLPSSWVNLVSLEEPRQLSKGIDGHFKEMRKSTTPSLCLLHAAEPWGAGRLTWEVGPYGIPLYDLCSPCLKSGGGTSLGGQTRASEESSRASHSNTHQFLSNIMFSFANTNLDNGTTVCACVSHWWAHIQDCIFLFSMEMYKDTIIILLTTYF